MKKRRRPAGPGPTLHAPSRSEAGPDEVRPDTPERILDAAERLFAARGFGATSLRSIVAAADVNLASVHYHFGSKGGLVRELLARLVAPMNQERLRRLDALEHTGPGGAGAGAAPSLEAVIDAFVSPALEMSRDPEARVRLLRLLAHIHIEADQEVDAALRDEFRRVAERFVRALGRILPALDREELFWRFHFAVGSLIHTVAFSRSSGPLVTPGGAEEVEAGAAAGGVPRGWAMPDLESTRSRLVRFLSAGMSAPSGETSRGGGRSA